MITEYLETGKVATEEKAKKIITMWKKMGFKSWYDLRQGFYFTYIKIK